MVEEPETKRVAAFIDGQNLFRSVKGEWGYHFPNYDVSKLALAVGELRAAEGWNAPAVRFYTGVPDPKKDVPWATWWQRKVAAMRLQGVEVFTRALRYREHKFTCSSCDTEQLIKCSTCGATSDDKGQEKGIDVRLALDIVRLAREGAYDVAVVFSQDQDLSEAVDEVKAIARASRRWIQLATAYPRTKRNPRGINGTDWIVFERELYDKCVDPRDYRHSK
jgi:uncharacterized LabA/DUF88 family protein